MVSGVGGTHSLNLRGGLALETVGMGHWLFRNRSDLDLDLDPGCTGGQLLALPARAKQRGYRVQRSGKYQAGA